MQCKNLLRILIENNGNLFGWIIHVVCQVLCAKVVAATSSEGYLITVEFKMWNCQLIVNTVRSHTVNFPCGIHCSRISLITLPEPNPIMQSEVAATTANQA